LLNRALLESFLVAEVLHLFQALAHGQPVREFDKALAVENKGFTDCVHGRRGSSRQLLLMDVETLDEFGIVPGRVKENITTRGIKLDGLPMGQRIRVGEALLEITKECEPCHQMDAIRDGLKEALRGRRGVLCRVIESGQIRRGDRIEIIEGKSRDESTTPDQRDVAR
jgi:MOSC domain-containing protein YiiM